MSRTSRCLLVCLSFLLFLSACTTGQQTQIPDQGKQKPITAMPIQVKAHISAPVIGQRSAVETQPTATTIPRTATGPAPYGAPPAVTALEEEVTQKLFATINRDRAAQGLPAFTWNATLSGGARLHSWNMFHCGFSHTCPDGLDQCVRIANEGFKGYSDCGENIGWAGPFPNAVEGAYKIHESMANEPPTGWHRIHLFSTTLHRVGVGVYIDPDGYVWFTEDMVS